MSNSKGNITSFIFMGDPQCSRLKGKGSCYSEWGALLQRALEEQQDCNGGDAQEKPLLIIGGDIVNRGNKNRQEEWNAFFEAKEDAVNAVRAGGDLMMATPINGAGESVTKYTDRFINTGNGPVGHESEFFSFDYGCCHYIFLNSDYMGNRSKDAYKFIGAWIRADLAVNRKPVVFTVMHHPVYTLGTSFEDDMRAAAIRDNYMKLLYRYGVDFILCGHQHAYARTKPSDEENQVMQVMGVSGGKHFEAWDKSSMDAISENVSVATIFETDGEIIKLRTIDAGGRVFDEYVQQARLPKKRKCGTCDRFSECRGTGKFELLEAEESARMQGDPLKPANTDGISVIYRSKEPDSGAEKGSVYFSNEDLAGLEKVEIEYSVMRRGELRYETKRGFRLDDLLERAGELPKEPEADQKSTAALILTNSEGRQKILPLYEVMNGRRFGRPSEVVPAIITEEDGGYRIIYGQQNAAQHNGRGWMRDIRQIEIQ